ncbi:DUF3427 domain-containing protein [Halalkalibacillus sediminis]|uniref:DUF3427 domain-containing protein n=1 Tax=Halalkalibacillus sediminis TaxID=2018042 RepID=A0A2I0QR51_9BACI|nr:DEAD/DEAH box helicase [Halalkalibacillus sediminis]PKR76812.1 DUF3427 domain-containing protein [Halalkalibacillus sediminis]
MNKLVNDIETSLRKGFIDQHIKTTTKYQPQLLVNNQRNNQNVLSSFLEELENCNSFIFSVAFITESGLATLKALLLDLKKKGINGKILTSTFLNFNQPKVFRELMKITNVEVRMTTIEGFHSKGYIFEHDSFHSLIVGSSNLTAQALKVNHEWNIKLTSHDNGEVIHHFKRQFNEVWDSSLPLTDEWINYYEEVYKPLEQKEYIENVVEMPEQYKINSLEESLKINPNKMQEAALREIQTVRDEGHDKGLVVSATGTGKTYLSAFDVRRFNPKRLLFIVHREQILKKAKDDYKTILGGIDSDFGILSGTNKDIDAKYLFATVQTISKEETLSKIDPSAFDYIIIDEVHKAGAKSYQKVIDYFDPQFFMGMTATPERTDDFNIYELFDYNIAYEIRLQEALEEDMLCPFHYFGVTDYEINGVTVDETSTLSKLVTNERVEHILDKVSYYGYSGDSVRGLMFCSRKDEAEKLSELLNERGLSTVALTGDHSQDFRLECVTKLESDELDYIITVDIFNEGIDIPSINQVVMLRQTESSIIFVQQLGRGLRKHNSKEFVAVIDFIGNYKKNYLIPVALSGDKSQNKDNIRRKTVDTSYINGVSTINFEEIAKKRIYNSINNENLSQAKMLREEFKQLKNKIGRAPYFYDFYKNNSIDPVVIADKYDNFYEFLIKVGEKDLPIISQEEYKTLTMFSKELLQGKRLHEIELFELLIKESAVDKKEYETQLFDMNCNTDEGTIKSVENILSKSFFTQNDLKRYGNEPLILFNDGYYVLNQKVASALANNDFFVKLAIDVVNTAKEKVKKYAYDQPFTLYEKYSRKDACKLLNWDNDESSTMYGYKIKHGTCPIFITYHKQDDVDSSVDYGDELISPDLLKWYTRSNRSLKSHEVQNIIEAQNKNIDIHIFIKKDDDEGKDFYYLGKGLPDKDTVAEDIMSDKNGKNIPVVHMNMLLENPVEYKLFKYITEE